MKFDARTMWTVRDVAHACKVTKQTVHNWISHGRLETVKAGHNREWQVVLVTDESVKKLMEEREKPDHQHLPPAKAA